MATLDEPYLVTSYGISPDQLGADKTANERFKLGVTSVIYRETKASKAGKQQSRRPIAVNTIQGNGIHLVDLSDQSPLSAFTVSPTTVFTCKAVSVSIETTVPKSQAGIAAASTSAGLSVAGRVRSRKTFVGLQQNGEYQLCCWTEVEDVDGTAVGDAVKNTKNVAHPIIAVTSFEDYILAFDSNGTITMYNQDLNEMTSHSLQPKDGMSIRRFEFHNYSNLLNTEGSPVMHNGAVFRMPVLCFEGSNIDNQSSPKKKTLKKGQSDAGQLSSQASQAQLQRVRLVYLTLGRNERKIVEAGRAILPVEAVVDCVQLHATKFATLNTHGHIKVHQLDGSALHYVRSGDPFAIPSVTLPLLSTYERGLKLRKDIFNLRCARLSPASLTQATTSPSSCLILAAPRSDRPGAVNVILWDTSLRLALASTETILPTLLDREGLESLAICPLPLGLVGLAYTPTSDTAGLDTQAQLAKRLTVHAMACSAPAQLNLASVVGKRALTQQFVDDAKEPSYSKASASAETSVVHAKDEAFFQSLQRWLTQDASTRDAKAGDKSYRVWRDGRKKSIGLKSGFARRLLRLAVPTQKNLSVPHIPVLDLLQSRRVSDMDVEGGLTQQLIQHECWELVMQALESLDDVPEDAQISALAMFLSLDAKAKAESRITLPQLLYRVVKAPSSPSILRSAMKKRLNADNVKSLLQVINRWLDLDLRQTAIDGTVTSESPGTLYLIPFLQALLDAHLVAILQSRDLHPLIQSVSSHLLEAISFSASLQSLQGPLDAISKEHEKEKARVAAMKLQASKKDQYELQAWNAKKALQENQLLLGDYAIETFQL